MVGFWGSFDTGSLTAASFTGARTDTHNYYCSLTMCGVLASVSFSCPPQIRKLFNLTKDDDVRKYVNTYRRTFEANGKKHSKAPKIQRLVTPETLQVGVWVCGGHKGCVFGPGYSHRRVPSSVL